MLGFVSSFVGKSAVYFSSNNSFTCAEPSRFALTGSSSLRMASPSEGKEREPSGTSASSSASSSRSAPATTRTSSPSAAPPAMSARKSSANVKLGEVTQARLRKVGDRLETSLRQIETFRVPAHPIPGKDAEVSRRTERMCMIMQQVFGNGYVFGANLADIDKLQSCYINGELSTKEFVRALAKSETYKEKFWNGRPPFGKFGSVELAFKHLLGRRTFNAAESAAMQAVYHKMGYEAMIDHIIDSEYDRAFPFENNGSDNMPHWREAKYFMGRKPEPDALRPGLERATGGVRAGVLYQFRVRLGSQNNGVVAGGSPPPGVNLKNKTDEAVFRITTAGYREPMVNNGAPGYSVGRVYNRSNGYSTVARSQRTYLVPLSELMETYSRIYKSGGKIRDVERV